MHPTCFEVVPEETSPWNPEIAPQAIVMNRKGISGGAPSGRRFKTGAWMIGCSTTSPRVRSARPVMSWWEFR
jgi:hypothetical protein